MPIEFSNLYCQDICRKNLQNFIIELSNSKEIYNKYSYEECYRMYYNLYIKNEKTILNKWISELIISLKIMFLLELQTQFLKMCSFHYTFFTDIKPKPLLR